MAAFPVAQRQREIGIRLALGARRGAIFATVLGKALIPALAGMAAGATSSLPLMRIIAAKATNVSPHDLSTYVAVALVLPRAGPCESTRPSLCAWTENCYWPSN